MSVLPNQPRIQLIGWFICAAALVIAARLFYIQVVRADEYAGKADSQYVGRGQDVFDRGSIYFSPRKGAPISAATLATGYTISLEPTKIDHPEDVYNTLSGILPFDENILLGKISASTTYTEIAKRVPQKIADRVLALQVRGVSAAKEQWRVYPAGKAAANVLGFVGYNPDGKTLSGRYGLEKFYNDILSRSSSDASVNFFAQIFSDAAGGFLSDESSHGSIVTTIEPAVEAELEARLVQVMKTYESQLTGGIVMNPTTGEIYAMAVNPTFDPNSFSKEKDQSVFKNPLVDGVYEMGSIVKPLVMAAGLDTDVVKPETTYDDTGFLMINGYKISNYDGKARGVISMQQVLNESLNVGMAYVARKLGNDGVTKYLTSLGFGDETGIDMPGEARGLIANLKSSREVEHVTAAFGQGIALSPIETIRALSALGNGGVLPNPHLVKEIDYDSGVVKKPSYDNTKRVFKPETSETITRMLVKVVDTSLLGGTVKLPRYTVAAKTGTAQMAREDGKGYYDDRYLHSFFGYFPAYKPQFIIFLFTVYPKGVEYASHTLTQPFIDLTKFLINYYEVQPDR